MSRVKPREDSCNYSIQELIKSVAVNSLTYSFRWVVDSGFVYLLHEESRVYPSPGTPWLFFLTLLLHHWHDLELLTVNPLFPLSTMVSLSPVKPGVFLEMINSV